MKTPIVIKTVAFAILVFAWAWAAPALAQVRCPLPDGGSTDAFEKEFTRKVTLPLINHDAGKLGPVLWAYIAGQACAESLENMKKKDGSFKEKSGLNLWNTQKDYNAEECSSAKHPDNPPRPTKVGCLGKNQNKPRAASKEEAKGNKDRPCWYDEEEGAWMQFVIVCFPKYGTVEEAAEKYLDFRLDYTKKLRELALAADGRAAPEDFFKPLKNAHWSNLAHTPRYRTNTLACINYALRGLASMRDTDQGKLEQVRKEIEEWCAQSGLGDAAQRQKLQEEQNKLINSLSTIARVCLSESGGQATVPTANAAINDCRMDVPKPQQNTAPEPSGGQAPGGAVAGVGEPHYTLPSGAVLT